MALKAGRVGVAKDQVDEFGHITGGGTPENVYTKSQCDNKFELKSHIGGLKFRDNDGTAQYMLPNGEWTNFSSGGSDHIGWYVPPELLDDTGCSYHPNISAHVGGYYEDTVNHLLYIDFTISTTVAGGINSNTDVLTFPSGLVDRMSLSEAYLTWCQVSDTIWSNVNQNTKVIKSSRSIQGGASSFWEQTVRIWGIVELSN